jgi:3-(3-hydroxy-phenyl)propionate hydroxylase
MVAAEGMRRTPVWRSIGRGPVPEPDKRQFDVIVVGGGPVGLTIALDLGQRGHRVLLINKLDHVPAGSRAICFAKRSLDIWHRLGVGEAMVEKGVGWEVGKVFWGSGADPVYRFDVLPVKQQRMPGFINLQQYHVEDILIEAISGLGNVDIRWGHEAVELHQSDEDAKIAIRTCDDNYVASAEWIVACDGSRSSVRAMMGLDFDGRIFEDNFLIADIKMSKERVAERWFWFDPPFNPGKSALLHKQPDDVWRLDFQLGWDVDRAACVLGEAVEPLIRGMMGDDCEFEREWYSVYTFQNRRMARFVHDRVIFAGDSAHLVSPFGARGCNGGIADADNLSWKLDLVLRGNAPTPLLDSYDHEAIVTADANLLNSSRSTDFMTPKSAGSRALRDATLELAGAFDFARPFVNSGRLSSAVSYPESALNTLDRDIDAWEGGVMPGVVVCDAPITDGWLQDLLGKGCFYLLTSCHEIDGLPDLARIRVEEIGDPQGLVALRYDMRPGTAYLIRPDQYVAARWRSPDLGAVASALDRARGLGDG